MQQELEKNARLRPGHCNVGCFSGKVVCPICSEFFGQKTWHSTDPYKRRVWQCNGKYRERGGGARCKTPFLSEEQLRAAFVQAFNQIVGGRERHLATLEATMETLTDISDLTAEAQTLEERSAGLFTQLKALVDENARRAQDQADYNSRYESLHSRYETVQARIGEIAAERQRRMAKRENIRLFIETLRTREALLVDFDEPLFRATVDQITLHTLEDIRMRFRDGREVAVAVKAGGRRYRA